MKNDIHKGLLKPLYPSLNGAWVSPEAAAKLAKNGKGITLKRMMDKIYAGELNGYVKKDHLGWWVFVPARNNETQPLKVA